MTPDEAREAGYTHAMDPSITQEDGSAYIRPISLFETCSAAMLKQWRSPKGACRHMEAEQVRSCWTGIVLMDGDTPTDIELDLIGDAL